MNKRLGILFASIFSFCASAYVLPSGGTLQPGQSMNSPTGKYTLVMQTDGNLVYYRNFDGGARWATNVNWVGNYLAMQADGNLVVYAPSGPAWSTGTHQPGTYLVAQDDGNLIIYGGPNTYWEIGPDPQQGDPNYPGDVVGRDLGSAGIGAFGHIGMYDGGGSVYEVLDLGGNVIRKNNLQSFKAATVYWGVADPAPPNYTVTQCFSSNCQGGYPPVETVSVRLALIKRTYQAQLIGADYTLQAAYRSARPPEIGLPAQRGIYRCDTFVVDVFNWNRPADRSTSALYNWNLKIDRISMGPFLPKLVFDKVKSPA